MNTQTTNQQMMDKLEELLEQKIITLVKSIDEYLTQNSEGIAYVPKPLLKVFEGFSSLNGKNRYRVTQNKFGYAVPCKKSKYKTEFTSYEQNKMLHYLFLAVAYQGYSYDSHSFGLILPNAVNNSIYDLAYWGVERIGSKKTSEKPLTAIDIVFSLISKGTLWDYVSHVEGQFTPNLRETTIDRVVTINVDAYLNLNFILNDEHCILMINKKGYYAKVSDETTHCIEGYEILLTPDGVIVAEMSFIGKTITHYEFKTEVDKFYSKITNAKPNANK